MDPCPQQRQRLGYVAAAEAAERRLAQGEAQVFCQTCQRWRWRDEMCADAVVRGHGAEASQPAESAAQSNRHMRRREAALQRRAHSDPRQAHGEGPAVAMPR